MPAESELRQITGDEMYQVLMMSRKQSLLEAMRGTNDGEIQAKRMRKAAASINDYLTEHTVANLILVDRAARPANSALLADWVRRYPGEKRPYSVFFLNPRGLHTTNHLRGQMYIFKEKQVDGRRDEKTFGWPMPRSRQAIQAEFAEKAPQLLSQKDASTVVYDNCIHSGDNMQSVIDTLDAAGFSDLRIGVASDKHNTSGIRPDFIALPPDPYPSCYLFGMETSVQKPYNSIYVEPTDDAEKLQSALSSRQFGASLIKRR